MPVSDAQRRASDKWLKEKVEEIKFRVPKGQKTIIQQHAFIFRAVQEAMERDRQQG